MRLSTLENIIRRVYGNVQIIVYNVDVVVSFVETFIDVPPHLGF